MRRKYRYKNRAEAEQAEAKASRQRLLAEWFASAIIQGRTREIGSAKDGGLKLTIGWFLVRHSCIVYCIRDDPSTPHVIEGLWDADDPDFARVIESFLWHPPSHRIGLLLDDARSQALREMAA